MNDNNYINNCRICGLDQGFAPWGEDGNFPTYEICPCCGVEFGYEDDSLSSVKEYRNRWLSDGCNWFFMKDKPSNWKLEEQLKNIPPKYR